MIERPKIEHWRAAILCRRVLGRMTSGRDLDGIGFGRLFMRRQGIAALQVVLVCMMASSAFSQSIPTLINYQGRIVDGASRPFTGLTNLQFNIYDAPTNGVCLWGPQSLARVPVVEGYFNACLGPVDDSGKTNITAAFRAPACYIAVAVTNGGVLVELLPRQRILAVPYALNGTPAGTINAFGGPTNTIPEGWLLCDGKVVSQSNYPSLFAAISTNWGGGTNAQTFNLPDLRGMFLRGSGTNGTLRTSNSNLFSGPLVGTSQTDQMQGHWHYDHVVRGDQKLGNTVGTTAGGSAPGSSSLIPYDDFRVKNPYPDGTNGAPRSGNETRPVCYGVNYIIKY